MYTLGEFENIIQNIAMNIMQLILDISADKELSNSKVTIECFCL